MLALAVLCLGLALTSCGGGGGSGGGGEADDQIPQPEIITSRDGVLRTTLLQTPAQVVVAGQRLTSNVFNGATWPRC